MLKRSLSWAWFGLAGAAVMLALLVSLLRFGSPWLAALQQQWLDRLLSEHQLTLNIGGLGLGWQDFGPVLVLEDVRLQRPQQPDLILRRASVDMQLWQSLRQWRPVLNELTLDGLRLTLGLSGEGEAPRTDITALRTLALQGVERLSLVDAQLVLAAPGKPLLELNIPALRWHNGAELHQGEGRLSFGPGAGQQFVFQGRLEGPIDRLSGGIYLQADRVDASPVLARVRPEDDSVSAELSFEAWLEWRQGELQAALLTLGQNRAGWGEGHEVVVKGGRLQWQPTAAGWQLASSDIDISVDGEAWERWQVQLDRDGERLSGYLDRLSFTDLALLAQWGEYYWPTAARQLAGIAPKGRLSGLRFAANADGSDWQLDGELHQVSTQAFGWVPQTQGLNGRFTLAAEHGRLILNQPEAADWHWDKAFRGPWPMRALTAELQWQKRGRDWWLWSDRLRVAGDDLDLEAWVSLQLPPAGSPLLSASARVDLHRAGRAGVYLPEPVMGTRLVDYLQGAIRGGHAEHAEVLWYGRLNRFPYRDGSGIFQARVPLRDAEFRFDPHWQPLTALDLDLLFENDGLYMTGPSGRLGQARAENIDARIVPLNRSARLALNAGIEGDGEAVSGYLQQSPLAGSVGATLQQVRVSGPLTGRLALDIPLSGGPVGVKGEVTFSDNEVLITPLAMPLTGVHGTLNFDEKETGLKQLQGRWLGQPLTVDYQGRITEAGYHADIGLAGRLQGDALGRAHPWLAGLQGEAGWQGRVQLNMTEGRVNYTAELDSSLAGLASRLPPPLGKDAGPDRPLRLLLSGDTAQARARLAMAPDIDAELRLGFAADGVHVSRLWLDAGGAKARLPRAPVDVAAHLAELGLDDWLARLGGASSNEAGAIALHWPERYRADLRADSGELWRQPLSDLRLTFSPGEAGRHRLAVAAQQAQGELAWGNDEPITASFDRLWLSPRPGGEGIGMGRLSPARVPALVFRCDDCRWRELALGKAGFQLSPLHAENGVQLDDLWLDGPLLQGRAQGRWLQHDSGDLTRLQWRGGAQSLQALWQALDEPSPFRDTQALLEGELSWPGLPWQPVTSRLDGTVSVETGAGVLTGVSDKGAGLLSVLSMDSILRRLRLDFRDVFEGGFYFDSIRATGTFEQGLLRNDDFLLKGAAGDMAGQGRVDLAAERLDYRFEFTPNLTGNLPVLAAFAVTPVTGLYVLALSKVLGPVVDVFTRIRYRVSGPLASPTVSELGREREQIRLPQNDKE
ncbi:YhdP family protein [Oceanimonas doudoroffii]|uniref:TIGR02099 family protein n=1 Tax=Oceanimonas doudoroffii TaxID=84158 RepID=A0A233RCU4_9GAMM|nr:YhdP family protein [Oceanimonas doudoroffii]OXY81203.1 TIGR02099 family protein [Oceanimonas doudoroffii]